MPDARGPVSGPLTTAEYVTPWSRVFPPFTDAAARTDLKAAGVSLPCEVRQDTAGRAGLLHLTSPAALQP